MNNKKLGTEFENRMCDLLKDAGWWVHFIEPKPNGAQPFDIIAVKCGRAIALDCKTSASNRFSISRLEENQRLAFDKWLKCGNEMPMVAVEYEEEVYLIRYDYLEQAGTIKLEDMKWARWGVLPV